MNKSPCFPFYTTDFFGDIKVRLMSPEAKAFYVLLLLNIWEYDTQFSIPNDEKIIRNLLQISEEKFQAIFQEILPCFLEKNGRLISKRLRVEKEKQLKYVKLQSLKGKKSAEKRATTVQPRFNHGSTGVPTGGQPEGNSSIPIPIPIPIPIKTKENTIAKTQKKSSPPHSKSFLYFYNSYPVKIGKKPAWEKWQKLKKENQLPEIEIILDAIKKQKAWRDNANGEFRPEWKHPAAWLNKGCWEDEVPSNIPAEEDFIV